VKFNGHSNILSTALQPIAIALSFVASLPVLDLDPIAAGVYHVHGDMATKCVSDKGE